MLTLTPEQMLSAAMTRFILAKDSGGANAVFFGTLILRLNRIRDDSVGTSAVDGRNLYYSGEYIASLSHLELQGVLAHEVMHCALKHFARRNGRHLGKWNAACDLASNWLLIESGYVLPSGAFVPGQGLFSDMPTGLSAEEYYELLPDGDYEGIDPGRCGGVRDAQGGTKQLEAEWNANVSAAQQAASRRGTLSAWLDRLCQEVLAPVVDWRAVLCEFITRPCQDEYYWHRPSKCHLAHGFYLPSRRSLRIGHIAVAIDTSGSIGDDMLKRFVSEVTSIAAQNVDRITTLWHDSDICRVEEWTPDDGEFAVHPAGGGGTDHRPVFAHLETLPDPPALLVCLTDLYSAFPETAPDYPVLWVATSKEAHPFGERVDIPVD